MRYLSQSQLSGIIEIVTRQWDELQPDGQPGQEWRLINLTVEYDDHHGGCHVEALWSNGGNLTQLFRLFIQKANL